MPLDHYTSLADHQAAFTEGTGILCYHKIGSRPRGTKLRSLYLPERLLNRQIEELSKAGFRSTSLGEEDLLSISAGWRVVLTFDDGSVTVFRKGLPVLEKHRFRAIQFIVSGQIGGRNEWDIVRGEVPDQLMDAAMIREWISAGHEIGAHTITHPRLAQIPLEKAREEITASKKTLEDAFGVPIRHFCYPYGSWNRAVRDLVEQAGFQTAVTLDVGVNFPGADPFALKRFGSRYPKRNFRTVLRSLFRLKDH